MPKFTNITNLFVLFCVVSVGAVIFCREQQRLYLLRIIAKAWANKGEDRRRVEGRTFGNFWVPSHTFTLWGVGFLAPAPVEGRVQAAVPGAFPLDLLAQTGILDEFKKALNYCF